ncbi:MAG: MurR/RpiR family transcriptional regulator [Peptostreptococcaceae bacterium]
MIIELTNQKEQNLTTSERMVVEFINNNSEKISKMSIVDIADSTFTSAATVSRAIKKCGLKGFSELRYKIIINDDENKEYKNINHILEKSLIEVKRTIENLSIKDIKDAIDLIKNSKRVYILARGLTELVATEFDLKLKLLGYNSFLITDPSIMIKIAQTLNKDEVVLTFSLRGSTDEIVQAVEYAKKQGAKVITCCCEKKSKLEKISDIVLLGEKHTRISIKEYEVTSRIPLQVISRAIIDYLIENENIENKII